MQSSKLPAIVAVASAVFACASEDETLTPDPVGGTGGGGSGSGGSSGSAGSTNLTASEDCNMSGIWAGHQMVRALALNLPQHANAWYYFEISQPPGSVDWVVTKHFDCGTQILGTVLVVLPPNTFRVHLVHNYQTGRIGKMGKNAAGDCEFSAERFWQIWGAGDSFLPPRNSTEEMPPVTERLPLPSRANPDGAEDWDNDGHLGVAYEATGLASGIRNSVQRSFIEWFTNEQHTITPALDWTEFVVRSDFDGEESTFDPPSGPLATSSTSDRRPEAPNRVIMKFLGRDATDPRVAPIVRGTDPEADIEAAVETCLAIQNALPPADG